MRIFLDTSILIEYVKGTKTKLLETIVDYEIESCINDIVYSEFTFHFLSLMSGKSPLRLKKAFKIREILDENEPIEFIDKFTILEMNRDILMKSYDLMKKYNFLPNDALILSTCDFYGIKYLASYDEDFKGAIEEGINLK